MRLKSPATVTWTVVDAAGGVVRTLMTDAELGAGSYAQTWDGRNDAGAFVPRGRYRTYVTASNGTQRTTQAVSVLADAFWIVASDVTPGRGQKITVTVYTAETLKANPRISVFQPGISGWTVSTSKVSSTKYRATITFRSSRTGTVRIKAFGTDSGGQSQHSSVYLPLH
jgi:hypothetical protein